VVGLGYDSDLKSAILHATLGIGGGELKVETCVTLVKADCSGVSKVDSITACDDVTDASIVLYSLVIHKQVTNNVGTPP
jgi:hypothetical protein